jgi:hypothetical protein
VPAQGRDGQYWLVSGTSPACALTAGVAALIKSVHPTLTPALVVQAITASTSNKPHGGYDEQVGFGTLDATAALNVASRLARDRDTGHGLLAAAQFGGGTAAIPAVPVTPRGRRQLVTDSVVALLCLAIALVVGFRLVVTRRAAVAAASAGPGAGPGPPGARVPGAAWTGPAPAGYRTPGDDHPAGDYLAQPGYGPPDGYGTQVGYQSPAAYRPGGNYAPPPSFGSPGDPAPGHNSPDGQASAGSYGGPAENGPLGGRGPLDGFGSPGAYGSPDGRGSLDGSQAPAADRPALGYPPPADYGSPAGYEPAAGGTQAGDRPPTGYRRPGGTEAPGRFPDHAGAGPVSAYQPRESPAPAAEPAEEPPAADDETWPSSGLW